MATIEQGSCISMGQNLRFQMFIHTTEVLKKIANTLKIRKDFSY